MSTDSINENPLQKVAAIDCVLSLMAVVLLSVSAVAIGRGYAEWDRLTLTMWIHLSTVLVAVTLTPIMLLRRRGDRFHRSLGYVWCIALMLTAASSFDLRLINRGNFSWIHILSVFTLIEVPKLIYHARKHDWKKHRSSVRGLVGGALIIAGFFTFFWDRHMARWLF